MVKTILKVTMGVVTAIVGGAFAANSLFEKCGGAAEAIENAAETMEEVVEEIAEGDIATE